MFSSTSEQVQNDPIRTEGGVFQLNLEFKAEFLKFHSCYRLMQYA